MAEIRVVSFTAQGCRLSNRIREAIAQEAEVCCYTTKEAYAKEPIRLITGSLKSWCEDGFAQADVLIFIGACGIAVRSIAPFVADKRKDPAVLVVDELGGHVISLLSGHLGGGNAWAIRVANSIGADPVITTASDVNGRLAIDVWAKENGLFISDFSLAKAVAARIVEGKKIAFHTDIWDESALPDVFEPVGTVEALPKEEPTVAVTCRCDLPEQCLRLVPKNLVLGIGCRKDKPYEQIKSRVDSFLQEHQIPIECILQMASIDLKKNEPGLLALQEQLAIPFLTFSPEELNEVPGSFSTSGFVSQITGVDNVCERAAVAALSKELQPDAVFVSRKDAANGVTLALVAPQK